MEFKEKKGIYLQIAETLMERFLDGPLSRDGGGLEEEERVPSIRETAEEFGVNPNTVMRSYAFLQELEIIQNRRGIGYFITPQGIRNALEWKKREFIRGVLPGVFRAMDLLEMNPADLETLYREYTRKEGRT